MTETSSPPAGPPPAPPAAPPGAPGPAGPRVTRDEVRDLSRLRRTSGTGRTVGGVAGGLGRHLDIDPVILKVAFVVLSFFGGAGLILYAAVWLLVPDDRATSAPLGLDDRSRSIGLVLAGGLAALAVLGTTIGDGFVPLPVVVLAGVVLLVVLQVGRRGRAASPPAAPAAPPSSEPGWATAPYAAPAAPLWTTPTWTPPPPRVDPRRSGPILFWFTLALCALGLGVLGTLDVAGAGIPGPAYPALVVATCGVVLVVGAFWGRAGGIILVGLLATLGLVTSVAVQEIDSEPVTVRPTTAASVQDRYTFDAGEFVLDLRSLSDPAALAGRSVSVEGDLGQVRVLVPESITTEARGEVDGPGSIRLFGRQVGGIDITDEAVGGADPGLQPLPPTPFSVRARLDIGSVEVQTRSLP